jgi:hypothetical protein
LYEIENICIPCQTVLTLSLFLVLLTLSNGLGHAGLEEAVSGDCDSSLLSLSGGQHVDACFFSFGLAPKSTKTIEYTLSELLLASCHHFIHVSVYLVLKESLGKYHRFLVE